MRICIIIRSSGGCGGGSSSSGSNSGTSTTTTGFNTIIITSLSKHVCAIAKLCSFCAVKYNREGG